MDGDSLGCGPAAELRQALKGLGLDVKVQEPGERASLGIRESSLWPGATEGSCSEESGVAGSGK